MTELTQGAADNKAFPPFAKGAMAYGLYLLLFYLTASLPVLVMALALNVKLTGFAMLAIIMTVFPVKNVFSFWTGIGVVIVGVSLTMFVEFNSYEVQKSITSEYEIGFLASFAVGMYIMLAGGACGVLVRKITGIQRFSVL